MSSRDAERDRHGQQRARAQDQRSLDIIQPLFILSQPRAGSTLLQRIVGAHPEVHTVDEPWVALRLLSLGDPQLVRILARYNNVLATEAWDDFEEHLPGGQDDVLRELGSAVVRLYERTCPPDARFFLDKTPSNSLIANHIAVAIPDARFVVLFRHPLAVTASVINTWGRGRWIVPLYSWRIWAVPRILTRFAESYPDRTVVVRYEDLVNDPESEVRRVCGLLGVDYRDDMVKGFSSVELGGGRMGDHSGAAPDDAISSRGADSWQSAFNNPLRRAWAQRYLRRQAPTLEAMGYESKVTWTSRPGYRNVLSDVVSAGAGLALARLPRSLRWWIEEWALRSGRWVVRTVRLRSYLDEGGGD